MTKLTPRMVVCPACGKKFTNRGYRNHVNKCPMMSKLEKKTTTLIRELPK